MKDINEIYEVIAKTITAWDLLKLDEVIDYDALSDRDRAKVFGAVALRNLQIRKKMEE